MTLELLSQEERDAFKGDTYERGEAERKARYLHKLIVGKLVQCFTDKQQPIPRLLAKLHAGSGFMYVNSFHTFVKDRLAKGLKYCPTQLLESLPAYRQQQELQAQANQGPPTSSSSPKKSRKPSSSPKKGTKRPADDVHAGPSTHNKSPKATTQGTLNFQGSNSA